MEMKKLKKKERKKRNRNRKQKSIGSKSVTKPEKRH